MNPFYTDYAQYLKKIFPDYKVQKISVNTGNSCPNRDGSLGLGGCIYCNNISFTPSYCFESMSVSRQLEAGKNFFRKKYKDMKYLAYFQSYTSTYNNSPEDLANIYYKALEIEDIVGLVIGTRPDCLEADTIALLSKINSHKPVFVEIGVETMHDDTLNLINRHHTSKQSEDCIVKLRKGGLHTGVHLIFGLPGENKERMLETVKQICDLDVESIKFHHLQVLKGTELKKMYDNGDTRLKIWDLNEYIDFCCDVVKMVPGSIAIERFLSSSPPEMVIAPQWGIKNYEFTNLLLNRLKNNE